VIEPPAKCVNARARVEAATVVLEWDAPSDFGGRPLLHYEVCSQQASYYASYPFLFFPVQRPDSNA
jgi:hypothetical protein